MRLLLFICFLFPVCALAQIEVVNESMICDFNSNILEIGRFNFLRLKNLPDSAVVSVSYGMIKSEGKRKNVYYIPGGKVMEGRSTNLTVRKNGKIIFTKNYRFRKIERYIDPIDTNFSGLPFRLGTRKLGKGGSFEACRKEILDDPAFYPLIDGVRIESFTFTLLQKRTDIDAIKNNGARLSEKLIEILKKANETDKVFLDNIIAKYSDGSCFDLPTIIFTIRKDCP